jgi:peptidoglycan/LPS O-acetylase OafA/YrhL
MDQQITTSPSWNTREPNLRQVHKPRLASRARDRRIDGLRGVAILLVIYHHLRISCGMAALPWFPFDGLLGVCLFFVISGYLITTILLREFAETQTISLPRFYGRRSVRIFPAFYVFISCMILARGFGLVEFQNGGLLASVFYYRNLVAASDTVLQHTWSLAVEEQFYLVWPFCLTWSPRRFWPWLVTVGLVAKPMLKLLVSGGYPDGAVALNSAGFDAVFFGVALALWMNGKGRKWENSKSSGGWTWFDALAPAALFALWGLYRSAALFSGPLTVMAPVLRNALVAVLVFYCLARSGGAAVRLLTSRALVWIGLISYSLYLWQQPFLVGHIDSGAGLAWRLILLTIAAGLSYFFVERTALRLRRFFLADA